ncbi:BACON domain-containing protein [Sphingobacterium faecale]|uniref:BACON domain-containing protein n=1 Tax=Sphingobacterium faecale TaxID=2803775 RepID=A0ABS1R6J7_9SPHI|nr:BACON domain-containing protein [Sphingobacterium faecale]MBL1410308.1 BACON domain-containing protein [Sphingobacterium faecale]
MNNINYILLCVLLVLASCKKEKDDFEEKLLMDIDYMEVSSKTNTYNFEVLSNTTIKVETDADWIVLDTNAYEKGKRRIGFATVTNADDERSGIISVRINHEESKQVLVIQESGKVPVFYVTVDGTGDGKSWSTPTDINTAVEKATTNSTIYLTEGVYRPSKTIRNGDANEDSDKTFEISKNITLIGGFAKDALPGAKPNAALYKTVLDGKLASGKEVFHTVTITAALDTESKVHLEGLTIQGGNATDRATNTTISSVKYSRGHGGGLLIANAIVYLKQIEVVGNKATNDKGTAGFAAGMYVFAGARVTMEDSKVNNNANNNNNGGGLWVADATLTAYSCQFNDNYAKGTAGGVHGYPNANIYLYDSEVMNNNNTSYGAGVYMRENSNAVLVNCLVVGNKSTSANGGGGVMQYGGTKVDIISSTITANEVVGPGGGVYRRDKVNNLTVVNSIISGNKQAATSRDIDAYTDNASIIPSLKNSIGGTSTYGDAGTIMNGAIFAPSSMLNTEFLPIGTNNPALTYGLTGTSLGAVGQGYNPQLDKRIEKDINGESRGGTVMGAKIR